MLRCALTIAFALAAIVVASTGPAAAATPIGRSFHTASAQGDLIALINGYRADNGLQPVSSNGALAGAATWMAGDMAAKNYIGHVSSDGRSPTQRIAAFGYPATSMYTGENLGAGYGTAGAVLAGWRASAAHNAVLLNPNYDAIGIGLVYNPSSIYKWFWAADFGGPGGTIRTVVPLAAQPAPLRAAAAPRGSATRPTADAVDSGAQARAAETRFIEATARRITSVYAVLHRMGTI